MSTPADDAGDVAKLRAEVAQLQRDYEIKCEARDQSWREAKEARAEADRLRAEVERLQTYIDSQPYPSDLADVETERDNLRVTLGKVAEECDKAEQRAIQIFGSLLMARGSVSVSDLRAILAADPVSLADVRPMRPDTLDLDAIEARCLAWLDRDDLAVAKAARIIGQDAADLIGTVRAYREEANHG